MVSLRELWKILCRSHHMQVIRLAAEMLAVTVRHLGNNTKQTAEERLTGCAPLVLAAWSPDAAGGTSSPTAPINLQYGGGQGCIGNRRSERVITSMSQASLVSSLHRKGAGEHFRTVCNASRQLTCR